MSYDRMTLLEERDRVREERDALAAELERVTAALREVRVQATRRKRASDLKRYLVTDLEIIERRCDDALTGGARAAQEDA